MPVRWFTSDLHIGHSLMNVTRGFGERFDDTWRHDNSIAMKWDAKVQDHHEVFVLGDLSMNRDKGLSWMAQRPGKKFLIAGNHDTCHPHSGRQFKDLKKYMEVFDCVTIAGKIGIAGRSVLLSHFPYDADREQYESSRFPQWRLPNQGDLLLHGHTHQNTKITSRLEYHVGWDAWKDLVSEDDLEFLFQSQGK